jgi:hypothetical protein
MVTQLTRPKAKSKTVRALGRRLLKRRSKAVAAPVKKSTLPADLPTEGWLLSPMTAGPYLVPITRWIE